MTPEPAGYGVVMPWFAVRHVIKNKDSYEERITVWRADSFDDAIAHAQAEAAAYAWEGTEPLDLFQAFELAEEPADGAEVFSLIRRSGLPSAEYLDLFFATGTELEQRGES
jgi:hypothetical protein